MPATLPSRSHGQQSPPPAPRRSRLGLLLMMVLVLGGAAFVFGLLPRLRQREIAAADTKLLSIGTVNVTHPSASKAADPIVLTGELRPLVDAPIYARASGYVRKWYVDIGAQVKPGQLIAEIETPEVDRQLLAARADLKQAEAASDLAQVTAKRWAQMLTNKTVSAQEAEEKASDYKTKQAGVESAQANVQRLEELTGFAKVYAPFAGIVTARRVDLGQLVTAGADQELFRISQTEKLRVYVHTPQSYARAIAVDQKAELTVPELPGKHFAAKVVRTAGAIDAASRTLLTELEVDNSKGELLSGSYAQVRLTESLPQAAITIPSNCLLFRAEGPQIGVVGADNHVKLKNVRVGRDFGSIVEILEGASASDRIIVNPPDALVDGVEVRVEGT